MVLRSMRAVLGAHDRFRNRGAGHGALEHAHSTNRRLVLVSELLGCRSRAFLGYSKFASSKSGRININISKGTSHKSASNPRSYSENAGENLVNKFPSGRALRLRMAIGMTPPRSVAPLAERGVRFLTASGDDLTDSDDLGRKMMRQVAGAFMGTRRGALSPSFAVPRAQAQGDRQEGWGPEVTRRAVAGAGRGSAAASKRQGKAGRHSYREISARLKDPGYCNDRAQPFNPQSIRAMIEGPQPRQRRPAEDWHRAGHTP